MGGKRTVRAFLVFQVLMLLGMVHAPAQDSASVVCQRDGKPQVCNGISVGEPKVFDNRTLTLMLEALSQTLASQQQSYIDQKSVLAALANLQGFTQTETARALNITGVPTPATSVKDTLKTGNVDSSGKALPDALTRESNVSRASVTPQAPALESFPAIPGFNPTYGQNAADLLNDQVNLTYQIFNLRMLLERSLSDRILPDTPGPPDKNRTRLQAVLGFNVTLDPPRTANDAVAVVEITVTLSPVQSGQESGHASGDQGSGNGLSLVALMPQEKTYNAATLSNKSNAFGGSAVVNAFQVGYSQRKREQIFYIYRDNDTLSYERMTGDPSKIVFGWMFRPVLGRNSVSPGLRQMFAIMALPNVDCDSAGKDGCAVKLNSQVRTYWKKYDRGTLSSYERHDTNRAKAFWFKLSAGLSKPQIFGDRRYENDANYAGPEVYSTFNYQDVLTPKVDQIFWRPAGAKNVVISAKGRNFFSQTKIALGDKIYGSESDGLVLKSNQAFDLTTTLDALVNGPGTILGRYGIGVPLISGTPHGLPANGVEVQMASLTPPLGGIRKIVIHLQGKASNDLILKEEQERDILNNIKQLQEDLKDVLGNPPLAVPKEKKAVKPSSPSLRLLSNLLRGIVPPQAPMETGPSAEEVYMSARKKILNAVDILERGVSQGEGNPSSAKVFEDALNSARATLNDALNTSGRALSAAGRARHRAEAAIEGQNQLTMNALPALPETPVISINGIPLDLPYEIADTREGGLQHVIIQASVKDSLIAQNPGGIVKVSWPFYSQNQWTATARYYDPDSAFQVTRLSQDSILIARIDGLTFVNGPEVEDRSNACWYLITGGPKAPLPTSGCKEGEPAKPAANPQAGEEKKKEKNSKKDSPGLPSFDRISDYAVIATLAGRPDKVVLVAPNRAFYTLAVPEIKTTETKVQPLAIKQYDSLWIEVKPADLIPGTAAKVDLGKVTSVEANGATLRTIPSKLPPVSGDGKAVKSIKVQITRDLTAKPGTVDVAFRAGDEISGTRQLEIKRTDTKGDK